MSVWEILKTIFIFDENNTMLLFFTSPIFWIFFMVVLMIYQGVHRYIFTRNLFLLLFSLFFYYKASGFFFLLILFSTLVDYVLGGSLYKTKTPWKRNAYLVASLLINLGLLAYFKYAYFFTDMWNQALGTEIKTTNFLAIFSNSFLGTSLDITKIILPAGISFYTFQTISYTVDIYKGDVKPVKNILDFAFFVSFFPQLIAGPIVRASDFVPQIYKRYELSKPEYNRAIFLIITGLIKKVVLADFVASNFIDMVFEDPNKFSGFQNLMAVYGYALQIYGDFSGYTDIAIGLALLLGFRVNINFNSPYVASSITDFWRRWHISLSSWLRDYLYISMGGNRTTSFFTLMSVPLIAVFLLLADGWDWRILGFIGILTIIWALYLQFKQLAAFGLVGVLIMPLFGYILFVTASWYLLVYNLILLISWIMVLFKPELKRKMSTDMNLMLTMLLGGLWHGAHIKFIIWGFLHGAGLALHKLWLDLTGTKQKEVKGFRKFLGQFFTFHLVCFAWIYFRAKDLTKVNAMLEQMFYAFEFDNIPEIIWKQGNIFVIILLGFIVHWIPRRFKDNLQTTFGNIPDLAKAFVISAIILIIYQYATANLPFIYIVF